MNTLYKTLSIALLSGCFALPALAQDVQKFGYVNPTRVYTETQTAKRIEATLQKEFGAQQQQLQSLGKQGEQLQAKLQSGKLSAQEKQQTEIKLAELGQQYRLLAAKLSEDYNLRRNEEFASLQQNANEIIRNIAEKEKFDLIVQEAVFVSHKYDITDRVIQQLDKLK